MKNKKSYNFFNPNKLILGVLIVSIVMLSSLSYAWYKLSITGTKEITLSSGALEMSFNDTDSGIISIENGEPLTDEDGLASTSYKFTLKNTGSIDSNFTIYLDNEALSNGLTRMSDSNIKYSLVKQGENPSVSLLNKNESFTNDKGVTTRSILTDKISAGSTTTYTLKVWIADNADNAVMNTSFKAKLRVEATQYIEKIIICKRATSLHNDGTHTYGNLGTTGILSSGDAFDCDVNGDKIYDNVTERFYYVDDNNSDIATLIYSNNVSKGVFNNTFSFAYDVNNDAYIDGPVTAIKELPTTIQWRNIALQNSKRDLIDELQVVRRRDFDYSGYAARLLTTQELEKACGITIGGEIQYELKNCKYLLENTSYQNSSLRYGYWLENPYSGMSSRAWAVFGSYVFVSHNYVNGPSNCAVRPAIEVSKLNIEY